jgi:hypothetical protein
MEKEQAEAYYNVQMGLKKESKYSGKVRRRI